MPACCQAPCDGGHGLFLLNCGHKLNTSFYKFYDSNGQATETISLVQAGLEFTILLPQLPEYLELQECITLLGFKQFCGAGGGRSCIFCTADCSWSLTLTAWQRGVKLGSEGHVPLSVSFLRRQTNNHFPSSSKGGLKC